MRNDDGKLINLELLIFGRMGIVESPLLQWNIFTDKVDKPAIHGVEFLNCLDEIKYNVYER